MADASDAQPIAHPVAQPATLPHLPRELVATIFFQARLLRAIRTREALLTRAAYVSTEKCVSFPHEVHLLRVSSCGARPFHNEYPFERCELRVGDAVVECSIGMWNTAEQLVYLVPRGDCRIDWSHRRRVCVTRVLDGDAWIDARGVR